MKSPLPSGIENSRSSVPLRRSRSVAMLVTRNITMNGKSASIAGPIVANTSVSVNIHATRPMSRLGTTRSSPMVRGSWRIWESTRPVVANVRARFIVPPPFPARAAGRARRAR